jgi:hypothetical protein
MKTIDLTDPYEMRVHSMRMSLLNSFFAIGGMMSASSREMIEAALAFCEEALVFFEMGGVDLGEVSDLRDKASEFGEIRRIQLKADPNLSQLVERVQRIEEIAGKRLEEMKKTASQSS